MCGGVRGRSVLEPAARDVLWHVQRASVAGGGCAVCAVVLVA